MSFNYHWSYQEANFGQPISEQISGGTHINFEIILKKDNKYIAMRRPKGIPEHELPPHANKFPNGLLYFCHNLIRYGETLEDCVRRIVKDQANVEVSSLKVVHIFSEVQEKDGQWSFNPTVIAEVNKIPETNSGITEVVLFDKSSIPSDFAWWTKGELEKFLKKYD